MLLLRRAARARGSACKRRQGRFPLTPLSARAILSRRIPAANASFTITPLFPASAVFAEIPPFRPPAFTVNPRQAVTRADCCADSAGVRLVPVFQFMEIMLRMSSKAWKTLAESLRTLDGL